ncbi:MAG: type IIL restriction-modification enzyme MmeI [Polyangiaceae bacterium]
MARSLDGRPVERITSFLFHRGGHENPAPLRANKGRSFIGSYILGRGFVFDDEDAAATPAAEMNRLFEQDARNRERVFPLQGGEQVNDDPALEARRFVINFADMSEEQARQWPDLLAIVESKVRPERMKLGNNGDARRRKTNWWRWGQYSHALFAAMKGLSRVLVNSQVSSHLAFAYQPTSYVFAHTLNVIASESPTMFGVVQSRVHECWARFLGSSLEERPRYTPSDCFETFPFPVAFESDVAIGEIGTRYYDFRLALMSRNNEGLTKTYNRFHDPDERSPDIMRLRALHAQMDRAVLDAYGWNDIQPVYDFREQLDERIKLTWSDDTRDEVLARLLN